VGNDVGGGTSIAMDISAIVGARYLYRTLGVHVFTIVSSSLAEIESLLVQQEASREGLKLSRTVLRCEAVLHLTKLPGGAQKLLQGMPVGSHETCACSHSTI
jgi:hypothetical protein